MNKKKNPSQGGQQGGLGLDHIEWVGQGKQFERFFFFPPMVQDSQSVQSLSRVQLFATPWTAAHQASLSIANSQSLLKLMSMS